jgi:hypothetical protein
MHKFVSLYRLRLAVELRRWRGRVALGFLAFICSTGAVFGIDREFGHPIFRTFNAHDYGQAGQIFAVTEDAQGRMLFGWAVVLNPPRQINIATLLLIQANSVSYNRTVLAYPVFCSATDDVSCGSKLSPA